jgi:hypothetical protein
MLWNHCCPCHCALLSPYWQGFEGVLPHTHSQRSQGAMMMQRLYACHDAQSRTYTSQHSLNVVWCARRALWQKRVGPRPEGGHHDRAVA